MTITKTINFLGYAGDLGGRMSGSGDGPLALQQSSYMADLKKYNIQPNWLPMVLMDKSKSSLEAITEMCQNLAIQVNEIVSAKKFFTVLGGDHSCAIGTWSGVSHAIKKQGALGLIWIDAHMDSHTPDTSPSGNIHGMPLAALLGFGDAHLTTILNMEPKLKPEHVCLIGVRSFEEGEAALLEKLNVRIFFIEEVKERGLDAVMQDALKIATTGTAGFGVTIDIDSIDPSDAPGTGSLEPNGLSAFELCQSLGLVAKTPRLLGVEIAEFDPHRDINHKTEKLIPLLLESLVVGK